MALNRIILWLGNSLAIIAFLMALTSVFGLVLLEFVQSLNFAVLSVMTGLIGTILVLTTRNIPVKETKSDALAFLLVFWFVIPFVLAVPYLATNVTNQLSVAYFEAVSAFTTTGASSLNPDELPRTMHIWRSLLQWLGGVVVATFAVVILAVLNLRGTGIHRSLLFTFKKGELFSRLSGVGRVIASIYGGISAVCFVGLVMTGTPPFEAICLALTSVSTGGLTPNGDVLSSYVNPIGLTVLLLACLLGAFNVSILWDLIRIRRWHTVVEAVRNVEHRTLLAIISLLVVIGFAYTGVMHVWTIVPEAIFFATSTGFNYDIIGLEMIPPVILIALALVGGSALSTAGGVKLIRILLLFRHFETDLLRLTHPTRTVPVTFRGQVIPDQAFLSIWMYFFGYTFVFGMGILSMSAVGMTFETAVTISAASLSNMGPLLEYTLPQAGYEALSMNQMIIASILMLVGRVEVLAFLSILSPGFWRS